MSPTAYHFALFLTHSLLEACAFPCLVGADLGGCDPTDNLCLCNNQVFIQTTTACIEGACTGDDLAAAEATAEALCASVVNHVSILVYGFTKP